MDDEVQSTCLSPEDHDKNIKDHLLHFLGCIKISDRDRFLKDPEYPLWKCETSHNEELIKKEKEYAANTEGSVTNEAKKRSERKREAWESECQSELRRIDFLRSTLAKNDNEKHLVEKIEESRKAWRHSPAYRNNITKVQKWRKKNHPETETHGGKDEGDEESECIVTKDYEIEKDVNVPFVQFEKKDKKYRRYESVDEETGREKAIWGRFPDQKTNIHNLLTGDDNLLHNKKYPERIRYFHIPSNNMLVSLPHFCLCTRMLIVRLFLVGRGEGAFL